MDKDVSWSIYFEDNERVADLLNTLALGKENVISPDDISSENGKLSFILRLRDKWYKKNGERDVLRKVVLGATVFITDIETQEIVDYGYPLRDLGYIYGEYETQSRRIRRQNKSHILKGKGGEILYRFNKLDKLTPVIMLLLYSGKEEWDGPLSLFEMMNLDGIPDKLKGLILNHKVNIINVRKISDEILEEFKTDVGKVFKYIKYSEDKEKLEEIVLSDEYYDNMDIEAAEVALEYTHEKRMLDKMVKTKEGKYSMCKAIQDMIDEGIEKGIEKGQRELLILTQKLLDSGRIEDLRKATENPEFRKALFKEFSI